MACGFARSKTTLILGRVIAGIGGGGDCNSISAFISSDHISPQHRALWHGIGTVVYTTGMGCGINDRFGWRWAFLVLAPISTLASIGVGVFLPRSTSSNTSLRKQLGRINYGGSITLVSSLALLLIFLNHDDSLPSGYIGGSYQGIFYQPHWCPTPTRICGWRIGIFRSRSRHKAHRQVQRVENHPAYSHSSGNWVLCIYHYRCIICLDWVLSAFSMGSGWGDCWPCYCLLCSVRCHIANKLP